MKPMTKLMTTRATARCQRGLVLFIALVALLVLSLAAVALVRSVDTATMIAGNMAFKQSTTNSAEGASIEANWWLEQQATLEPMPATPPLTVNNPAEGYFAQVTHNDRAALTAATSWTAANSKAARVKNKDGDWGDIDPSGNQIRYIVERMCRRTGPVSGVGAEADQACLFGPGDTGGCSKGIDQQQGLQDKKCITEMVMYRITSRVQGPKDTLSFTQTFVY